ncbi:MAG: hypothetical protein V5A47_08275 [Bacteroidales bacterium]|nr:hypothetical protein [Bacteroidales bacterium]
MMRITSNFILVILICLIPLIRLSAQEQIDKRVQVVRSYRPEVKEAYKISELPEITDTTQTETEFDYYLLPKRVETQFDLDPIPSATMVSEPIKELYGSYVKIGLGSKLAPLAEFSITNKRSKNRAFGAFLRHRSSPGKVAMPDGERVFAGYSTNKAELFGKQFFENSVLELNLGGKHNTRYFYGYNTNIDTTLLKDNIRQNFTNVGFSLGYNSTYIDSSHLNYDLQLEGNHLNDNFNTTENRIKVTGDFDKFYDNFHVGMDAGYTYIEHQSMQDTVNNNLVKVSPWVARYGDGWRIQGGISFFSDIVEDEGKARIYPAAQLEYDMVSQYFIPYGGIDGKLALNPYKSVTEVNPFIMPGLHIKNTNYNMIFYAGMRGHLSPSTFYNVRMEYTFFDDMYFFVNEIAATDRAGNQFDVVYGNGEKLNLFGELSIDVSNDFNLRLKGNYYDYVMYDQARPWHKPNYDLTFSARYDLRDKIILQGDLFLSGRRWVKPAGPSEDPFKLEGYADLNLDLEYRYSKVLSGFLKLKNLLANNYSIYNNYPVYGLHAYLGITYAF